MVIVTDRTALKIQNMVCIVPAGRMEGGGVGGWVHVILKCRHVQHAYGMIVHRVGRF